MVDQELVARALATVSSSPANREYFFANLRSPAWLGPLRAAGRFKSPMKALQDDRGISFVRWPESEYLVRMAALSPDLVRDIILESQETDNERVHQDFVEAAIRMPSSCGTAIAEFEAAWIRKRSWLYTLYPEKVGELISHLARNGEVEVAIRLLRELLVIAPVPEASPEGDDDALSWPPEPRGKCRKWDYQWVLSNNFPDLVQAAPDKALALVSDLLETALRVHSRRHRDKTEDYSWIWRPEIEAKRFDDIKDALVSATAYAALRMSTSAETSREVGQLLWSRNWRIFRRLAAHTLLRSAAAPMEAVEDLLTRRVEYKEFPGHSPEFDKLLAERFSDLSAGGREEILALIERGPDLNSLKRRRRAEGRPATEDEVARVADSWRLQWLHRIRGSLDGVWTRKYSTLTGRVGVPREDNGSSGIQTWVGPASPKTEEDLRQMSGEQLVAFLKAWRPTGQWNAPSAEGLGRSLSAMMASEPNRLARDAALLRGLEPTYVRSAIDGFTGALKNGQSFDISSVLGLCEWAVGQGNEEKPLRDTMDSDPDWNWTRKSIGWFLNQALSTEGQLSVSLSERGRIWALLENLAEDPVPMEQEQPYGRGMFVGSASLNVTRGVALDGMLQYARWLDKLGAIGAGKQKLHSIPELKRIFEKLPNDRSTVTREVLGRGFPTLFWLDGAWAASLAAGIFGEGNQELGDIAFANYLLFCPPYHELLRILAPYYRRAVDLIGKGYRKDADEVDRRLAQHLMLLYWHGKITMSSDDGLIKDFFGRAPARFRSVAIEFIGRNLYGAKPVEPQVLKRLEILWEWRKAELKQRRCDGEPVPFGIWFASGQFDLDWSFDNLLFVLRLCHKAELDFWVAERLAAVSKDRPAASVEALGAMIEVDKEGWAIHGWQDHPRTVLANALESLDEHAQQEARRVIHLLGSRGWYGYRDLLRVNREDIAGQ